MMMMMKMMVGGRHPFTASQWQELQFQSLIFHYIATGIPIPCHLILSIRRSFMQLDPTALHPYMVYGRRKAEEEEEDPEPGRCRRTDGKKWRCSKEAAPDSKYCERHMHRGKKGLQRKSVVEKLLLPTKPSNPTLHLSLNSYSAPCHPSSPAFSPQNNTAHKSYRCSHGTRECVDERNFFSKASREERENPWWLRPKQSSSAPKQEEEGTHKHCFVLGADLRLERPVKVEEDEETEKTGPLHCFFNEWPRTQESKGSWIELEDTKLSISPPHIERY